MTKSFPLYYFFILTFTNNLPATASHINVKVQLVKDVAGNYLANLTANKNAIAYTATHLDTVTAVATDKVEITFTKALQSVNENDFKVAGHAISYSELSADGKKLTLTLKTDLAEDVKAGTPVPAPVKLSVEPNPSSVDILGEKLASNIAATEIVDEINATVEKITATDTSGTKFTITFNEAIKLVTGSDVTTDLVVKDSLGKAVTVTGATVSGTNDLVVTLGRAVLSATVSVKDSRFITDNATVANAIADIDAQTVELGGDTLAASVITKLAVAGTIVADETQTLVFSEALNAASKTTVSNAIAAAYVKAGTATVTATWNAAGDTLTVLVTADAGNTVTVGAITPIAVTDLAGNVSTAQAVQTTP